MGALEYEPETRLEAFEPQSIRLDTLADNVDRGLSEALDTGVLDPESRRMNPRYLKQSPPTV